MTREQVIAALVAEYGPKVGPRNPDWDINQPDSAKNAYHLPPPPPEEVAKQEGAWVTFNDHDDSLSIRAATLEEIADVIVKAIEEA